MSMSHFSAVAKAYAKCRPSYPIELARALKQEMPRGQSLPVLDVGCGPGNLTRILRDAGCNAIGMDPVSSMIVAAQEQSGPSAAWIMGRGEQLPFRDAALGGVVCSQSLHWIDERRLLPEARRCLCAEGVFAVTWQEPVASDVEGIVTAVLKETVGLPPDQVGRRRNMDAVLDCIGTGWDEVASDSWSQSRRWSPEDVGVYLKSRVPAATDRLVRYAGEAARAQLGDSFDVAFRSHLTAWK